MSRFNVEAGTMTSSEQRWLEALEASYVGTQDPQGRATALLFMAPPPTERCAAFAEALVQLEIASTTRSAPPSGMHREEP